MSEGYQEVVAGGGGGVLPFYHVPQQSRREKLRYPSTDEPPPLHTATAPLLYHNTPLPTTFISPLPPPSSSYLLNPSYSTAQFDHTPTTTNPFLLRDHLDQHPLFNHQGISLSLSSSSSSHHNHPFDASVLGHKGAMGAGGGPLPVVVSRPPVPTGPFTGYAAVLKGSRFLAPAQQLLEEDCYVGICRGSLVCVESSGEDGSEAMAVDLTVEGLNECEGIADGSIGVDRGEHRRMKTRLISMLDEVYRRYKQYYQQIQAVITSFESVAGLSTAVPYSSLALKSMSNHFQSLKNNISDQLHFTNKALGKEGQNKEEIQGLGLIGGNFCYQRIAHNSGNVVQQHVWRPQRGLPERAVNVLKAWLFEHFLHPYPTDTDKQMLAKQTGLSRNQVSNWFINARVRLWKPMVEEIHALEMRQACKVSKADNNPNSNKQTQPPTASATSHSNKQSPQNISSHKSQDPPPKRFRNEFAELSNHIEEPLNFSFDDLSSHHRAGVGITGGGSGVVSLTLGLHQNNGNICLSEPLPLNVIRRFGLEESNIAYLMGGLEGQDRHFGKDIDGQMLRDLVG